MAQNTHICYVQAYSIYGYCELRMHYMYIIILSIYRCDIPVVIMGETGCGKTRLIRYMCDLARGGRDLKNMLILKVHIHVNVSSCQVVAYLTIDSWWYN